ncbi:MAG: Dyp-type peroxidase, partial [Actinomycetota bacterium]|nr:Dyp-type peroxidase [Actinomycetota bacterium]
MPLPEGVLPNPVIRDPRSSGLFVFGQLDAGLTPPGVQTWLQEIHSYLNTLRAPDQSGLQHFDAAVGFGPSFFQAGGTTRFGLDGRVPAAFTGPPALPATFPFPPDFLIYAVSDTEEKLVQLVQWLFGCKPTVTQLRIERGYQRANRRESFGFLDGQRNPGTGDRISVALVGIDRLGDEPSWVEDATYLSYMKIKQDLDRAKALGNDAMEQAVGRRKDDGSRLDQQAGVGPMQEPDFNDPANPRDNSHIRKVGPRGQEQGTIAMLRRGLPYMDIKPDGSVEFGLHFVSFGDLDDFNTILNRWMTNAIFPAGTTGPDLLLTQQLISFELAALFIVPPKDERYIGAQIFDAVQAPPPATKGRVIVKKRVTDATGNPLPQHTLRGAVFQLLQNGNPVGGSFTTDAAGHAMSGD